VHAPDLDRARDALLGAVAVCPHTDADGLGSGAIALRARREDASAAILLGRGETPWRATFPDGPVAVLDQGLRDGGPPGLYVDHHVPEAEPRADQLFVTAYGEDPEVPTAPLMRRIVPEAPAWLAAVGAAGDLGDKGFALPECAGAPKTATKQLVSLVNAPRRLPDGPVREALAILVDSESPKAALADPRIGLLREAKDAWRAELDRVVRTAPQVGDGVAVLRFSSPCQVHPIVATTWARRLAPRMVLAANDGYLGEGTVNFAVRGGAPGESLPARLRAALPDATSTEFAHGHDKATGGSLTADEFERLLRGLGLR
jgi:single-stranded-DNA-specific exonuclease